MGCGKLQCSLCSGYDRRKHLARRFGCLLGACLRSGVNHKTKVTARIREIAHVTCMHQNSTVRGKMRALPRKCIRIATENDCLGTQSEELVYVTEALNKPTAKKSRSPRDEDALPSHFGPQAGGLRRDSVEVFRGNLHREAFPGRRCLA